MGKGQNDRVTPTSRPMSASLSSQMSALEAASQDRDDDSSQASPIETNTNKGKSEIKQEHNIKTEMDDEPSLMDTNSNHSNSNCGKNTSNDMPSKSMSSMKAEVKTEAMDQGDNGESENDDMNETKHEIKDEPMSAEEDDADEKKPKTETKPVIPEPIQQDKSETADKKKKCLFNPEELQKALMPTLQKLYQQEAESMPFLQPVDPNTLGIPDYFDIVRKPMDMSTIQKKLTSGQYSDPWEYVDDVWLMFDNAWLYNRKTSRVYRYCTKVRMALTLQNRRIEESTHFGSHL